MADTVGEGDAVCVGDGPGVALGVSVNDAGWVTGWTAGLQEASRDPLRKNTSKDILMYFISVYCDKLIL